MAIDPLASQKREVPEDFNIVASTYDKLVKRNPGYVDHLRVSADRLRLPAGGSGLRLLDLCCGTGLSTAALMAAYPRADIIGLDASAGMLKVARAKPEFSGSRVSFVLGDAMDPSVVIGPDPFDGILMAYGIRNMSDRDLCLGRILALLRPDAPISFHEYSVADSPRAKATWTAVAWGIIIPSGLITSRHTRIYRYLWRSVLGFDGVRAFEQRLEKAGFGDVHVEDHDGWQKGIVHTFLGRAPRQ